MDEKNKTVIDKSEKLADNFCIICYVYMTLLGILSLLAIEKFNVENRTDIQIAMFMFLYLIAIVCSIGMVIWGYRKEYLTINRVVGLLVFSGFILRILYVSFTDITVRSDDVYTINDTGHMGYIYWLFSEFRFPIDPASGWEFPQPPLHHILAAIWMKIFTSVGVSIENACEGVQYLTSIYTTLIVIFIDKLYQELTEKENGRIFTMLSTSFFPYMIVMSGDINNDALLTLLMIITIWLTVRWWKNSSLSNILLIAISFGLAMMTKYSVALLVPPITMVFLVRFFKDKEYIKYIKQFCLFLIVCGPISMWWPIRLKVKYGLDFGFVQASSITEAQYIGNFTVFQRLFDLKNKLDHSYIVWDNSSEKCDYNIFVNLIKSGCFGEQDFIRKNAIIGVIGNMLFFVMIIFCFLGVCAFVHWMVKGDECLLFRVFLAIIGMIVGMSAVIRTLTPRMAFICNSNIRFIMVAVLVFLLIIGLIINKMKRKYVVIYYGTSVIILLLSSTMWILCVMYH